VTPRTLVFFFFFFFLLIVVLVVVARFPRPEQLRADWTFRRDSGDLSRAAQTEAVVHAGGCPAAHLDHEYLEILVPGAASGTRETRGGLCRLEPRKRGLRADDALKRRLLRQRLRNGNQWRRRRDFHVRSMNNK
jgi:hypothetical protein